MSGLPIASAMQSSAAAASADAASASGHAFVDLWRCQYTQVLCARACQSCHERAGCLVAMASNHLRSEASPSAEQRPPRQPHWAAPPACFRPAALHAAAQASVAAGAAAVEPAVEYEMAEAAGPGLLAAAGLQASKKLPCKALLANTSGTWRVDSARVCGTSMV